MVDPNATMPILGPVSYTLKEVFKYLEFFVGGIFGIYVITLVVRIFFFRKLLKLFKEMKNSMKRMEAKIDKFGKKRNKE